MEARPTIMVTNDDGIDAPGLRALVGALVSTNLYHVRVCAPHLERSATSHSIIIQFPLAVKEVEIQGAEAYSITGTPADCTALGLSKALFPSPPDLVLSGINKGGNYGYTVVYSGTVAGAREAFLMGVPSMSISYNWFGGERKSTVNDYPPAAEACLPIISAILADIKNKTLPRTCFLNINLPSDIQNHKGYKLTKQSKNLSIMDWVEVTNGTDEVTIPEIIAKEVEEANSTLPLDNAPPAPFPGQRLFSRKLAIPFGQEIIDVESDEHTVKEGYIAVTPLFAVSDADAECRGFFKDWLPLVQLPSNCDG